MAEEDMDIDIDAQWKKIQEKTFTRWTNEQLKVQKVAVKDLTTDFGDGVLLIVLLEVLSQKSVGKYNKKPRVHAQKMENLEKVLKFITDKEGIRLVNIGSGDIVEGNLKLILGLIWTLILHYQISMGFNIDDDDGPKRSGKQALLEYIQKKIPHKNIKNFTSDWNDGTAVAALVDAHAPGLCPEADTMDPNNALQNATYAMQLGDDWLGIPQVLGPEDMTNPHVDELSMMTYLSQFPEAELKEGAPIGPKEDPKDITKVKVSGSGITGDGARVGKPAKIIVDCSESGVAPVTAKVTTPSGDTRDIEFEPKSKGSKVYEGNYVPEEPGHYGVEVDFDGEPLPDSPYQVAIGNPDGVRIGDGPELAFVDEDNVIDVFTNEAGPGDVTAEFTGPIGSPPVKQSVVKVDDSHVQVHFSPETVGVYKANVLFNGFPVEDKPLEIHTIDLSKVIVTGPGIQSGNPAKAETYFDVDARQAGDADLDVSITDPEGKEIPIEVTPLAKNAYRVKYTPQDQGDHVINVKYGGKDLKDSPYFINVDEPGYVKCTGDGLTHAVVNEKAEFVVDATKAGPGGLGLAMEGPGEVTDMKCEPGDENGIFNVSYVAPLPGVYKITVKFNDEEVPGAPFEATVSSGRGDPDASQCIVTGIESGKGFEVDCKNAGGNGLLEVGVTGAYVPADYIAVKHNGDYTFSVSYHISVPGETTIVVKWHGEHLTGSPFTINTE